MGAAEGDTDGRLEWRSRASGERFAGTPAARTGWSRSDGSSFFDSVRFAAAVTFGVLALKKGVL